MRKLHKRLHFEETMKTYLIYLIRKYSSFSTITLTSCLVAVIYGAYILVVSDRVFLEVLNKALGGILLVTGAAAVTFLPYDLFKIFKDKKMCKKLNLEYRSFAIKTEEEKDEIRDKFSEHA